MALYQDGILISGANTLPKMTLAEYNALPADQRPTYWERLDADYDDVLAPKTDIATVESGTTASRAYSAGELVYVSGTLYRVKTAIASGATFTVGTNIEAKNVSDVMGDKVNNSDVNKSLSLTATDSSKTTYTGTIDLTTFKSVAFIMANLENVGWITITIPNVTSTVTVNGQGGDTSSVFYGYVNATLNMTSGAISVSLGSHGVSTTKMSSVIVRYF